jgi:hypothetical protein
MVPSAVRDAAVAQVRRAHYYDVCTHHVQAPESTGLSFNQTTRKHALGYSYADERLLPHLRSVPVLGGGVVGGAACDRADPS